MAHKKNDLIQLETPRLILRQWQDRDIEPFAAMNADPEVMRYFPQRLSRLKSDAMLKRCCELIEQRGWGFWAVEHKQTGELVGMVGLHQLQDEFSFSPCVEVGWRLTRQHWGRGYATEAANESLRFAFEQLQLASVVSFTSVVNQPSQRVMQRLGMTDTGENFAHPKIPEGHSLSEHVLYRISNPS